MSKYHCEPCLFNTINKKDYEKHLLTNKHYKTAILKKLLPPPPRVPDDANDTNIDSSSSPTFTIANASQTPAQPFLCLCGKKYKNEFILKRHKRKCAIITPEIVMNIVQDNQELRNIIVAQNKIMLEHTQAFHQHITDLIPKLGKSVTNNNTTINNTHHTHNNNNNNNFSLNIFLNEKCKDAWNMSEFIESLHVTLDDLLLTRERGIGESIGRMLVHGLSTLDVYKRPIHCTDLKRDIMYVKDNEVWERDEQNVKIRGAIDQLSYKQIIGIDDWKHTQPDMAVNDDLQLKYTTILLKVLSDPDERDARKIVKCISKGTLLDKEIHAQMTCE
jgi:hypothetical protein